MAGDSFLTHFFTPLRTERLWVTLVWSLTLAVGAAAWDQAELAFEAAAAGTTMVLLPLGSLDEAGRDAMKGKIQGEPGVAAAVWLSPRELTERLSRRFPQGEWHDLFPKDDAWLSWMLEVRPSAPLDTYSRMNDIAARRRQEGVWRMVLWDGAPLEALAGHRHVLHLVLGFFLALVGLGGVAALLRIPLARPGRAGLLAWSGFLGLVGPGAVWSAALLAGAEPDDESLMVGLGVGFLLATFIAPMIRLRQERRLSLTVGEDAHERVR